MRKFKGLLCSVSMAAVLLFSGMAVYADETEAASETATEAVSEAAADVQAAAGEDGISASDRLSLETFASESIQTIVSMTDAQIEATLNPTSLLAVQQDSVVSSVESWNAVKDELGAFKEVQAHDITVTDDDIIIKSACVFENAEGEVTTTLSRDTLTMEGISFSSGEQSFGEKMQEAALNTVMGIGIVFLTLLFLSFLIGQFKHISKLENALVKKNETPAPAAKPAPAPVAAPAEEEETVDDGELIAVIAAAIAAAEGTSTDGFVVRSIKKHNRSKWQRA